jgi:hypothetical protein
MRLIYLREETPYEANRLVKEINSQLTSPPEAAIKDEESSASSPAKSGAIPENESNAFAFRLKEAMDNGLADTDEKTVVKKTKDGFSFHFIGLFDYVDKDTDRNLTFFFMPKFVPTERLQDSSVRDTVLLAIDHYKRNLSQLGNQAEETEKHKEGLLELVVRVLRDYLENGVYTVQRRELEHNGQGEIDWETTIDQYQPVFLKGREGGKPRPVYMDYATELAWADEEHYITRLHQCLVTTWGRKLEELGLSSVLRVNVPLLTEAELDWFGETDYQIAQIDKELKAQFVTKARATLSMMKELINRMSESQSTNDQSLSFGMNGAEHLWEAACAEVLGSELDMSVKACGLKLEQDCKFRDYMPKPIWNYSGGTEKTPVEGNEANAADSSIKSGWKLDFIRTWKNEKGQVEKLVILDAKYYDVSWNEERTVIYNQPGIGDIAKQIFYQMAFKNLAEGNKNEDGTPLGFVNAFLFPEDDSSPILKDTNGNPTITASESVHLGWKNGYWASAFSEVNLFAVRLPGIELLRRYACGEDGNDWFEEMVGSSSVSRDSGAGSGEPQGSH